MTFDHEKLTVYQEAIAFVAWAGDLIQKCPGGLAAKDHLDRASTSIPLNIAEGNGKWSGKDRAHYLEIARGSALECAACLDVLVARKRMAASDIQPGKESLGKIVSMLVGLIRAVSNRVGEETPLYRVEQEQEQEKEHEQEHEQEQEKEHEQEHEQEREKT